MQYSNNDHQSVTLKNNSNFYRLYIQTHKKEKPACLNWLHIY